MRGALQDDGQSEHEQSFTAPNNYVMLQNLQLMREVITDMGQEVDSSYVEIDKLKLNGQRLDQSIEEMKQKFNFI